MLKENCLVGLKVITNARYIEDEVNYIIDFKRELKKGQFVVNTNKDEDEGYYVMSHEMEPYSLTKGSGLNA